MLSNLPYGKGWKTDLERVGGKKDLRDSRFLIEHDSDLEYSLVARSSDGQMLYLANRVSKMKQRTRLGSRIAEVRNDGRQVVVEYEPDNDLRDTEQILLHEGGSIEAFPRREILPYAPDAWYQPDSAKVGYEINFNRYFYKPQPMRTLEEIRADIPALEKETADLLDDVLFGRP